MTLCGYHHRLLHEGGFGVEVDSQGGLTFTRSDGRPILSRYPSGSRFRGSARKTALAEHDREIADLIAINASLGLDIDAGTARTRWLGERMDYSMAIERMYFDKHGQL